MENNNNPRELAEIVETSMREFREGMQHREQMSIRIGRRTTQIIRFGMTGMAILGMALFYLIFILTKDFSQVTKHMDHMSDYMQQMQGDIGSISSDIGLMQKTMMNINDNTTILPAMNNAVANMDGSLVNLSGDVHSMVEQIHAMNGNVGNMAANIQLLNRQITDMNVTMGYMSSNVNQMSKPMKMLPFQ
ncbi:MAG: hypothetical protein OEY45_04740 [Gammaproteobacteria bacterium]|nr:hypothetical protein [Gammaproteobacteria bacterium]